MKQDITRRSLAKGAAWATPVIAATSTIPAYAASPNEDECKNFNVNLSFNSATPTGDGKIINLTAVNNMQEKVIMTITSSLGEHTVTAGKDVRGRTADYNMRITRNAWGPAPNDLAFCYDADQWSHSRNGGLVLNQMVQSYETEDGYIAGCGPEFFVKAKQTLQFTFMREVKGVMVPFDPKNLKISIYDITSVDRNPIWRTQYKDAVGFSVKPDKIEKISGPYPQGIGEGTFTSPYHRAEGHNPTDIHKEDQLDSFVFNDFPSGSTMEYTNARGYGRQFILLDSITFEAPCKA